MALSPMPKKVVLPPQIQLALALRTLQIYKHFLDAHELAKAAPVVQDGFSRREQVRGALPSFGPVRDQTAEHPLSNPVERPSSFGGVSTTPLAKKNSSALSKREIQTILQTEEASIVEEPSIPASSKPLQARPEETQLEEVQPNHSPNFIILTEKEKRDTSVVPYAFINELPAPETIADSHPVPAPARESISPVVNTPVSLSVPHSSPISNPVIASNPVVYPTPKPVSKPVKALRLVSWLPHILRRALKERYARRKTFGLRYLWKCYLRRLRERPHYKQLGRLSRIMKLNYYREVARFTLHRLQQIRLALRMVSRPAAVRPSVENSAKIIRLEPKKEPASIKSRPSGERYSWRQAA